MQNLFFEVDHHATEDLPFWSCNARGIAFLPHYHSSVEFFFVLCGSVTAELEDGSFVLRGGDLLVVMPGQIHGYSRPSVDAQAHTVKVLCSNAAERIDFSHYRVPLAATAAGTALNVALRRSFEQMRQTLSRRETGYAYRANALRFTMLYDLLTSGVMIPVSAALDARRLRQLTFLREFNEYIVSHYSRPVTLADACRSCGYSESYFSHQLKALTGHTFLDFLNDYRLKAATELLVSAKHLTHAQIAQQCGFSDVRAFNRAFRRTFDCTPSEYRAAPR